MSWNTVYLIVGIILGFLGIWNLAQRRNAFLSLAGILWFLIVLTKLYIPRVYGFRLLEGIPELGPLVLFVLLPIFIVLAFFWGNRR